MNIFHKITRKSLKENKVRTAVTIIGIILSMAMFTAVIEGSYSGIQYLIRTEVEEAGAYHGFYYNASESEAEEIRNRDDLKECATWQVVGWSNIETDLDFNPYFSIVSVSDNFPDLVNVKLLDGRMPENENEILIPSDLHRIAERTYSVGGEITLSVGKRTAGGRELTFYEDMSGICAPEEIVDQQEKTYRIVGIYRQLAISLIGEAGYLGITKGEADGPMNVFFTLKRLSSVYKDFVKNQPVPVSYEIHKDLLLFSGVSGNDSIMSVIYGLSVILIILIAFGSICLIYNSFSISVSERTKQFGVLKSIGATKKQILRSVLYEAFLLSGIGIPVGAVAGCVGTGITLWSLRDAFEKLTSYSNSNVKMHLILNPVALLCAAVICLLTVIISAWIPAKRASRRSAIDAIRQADDLKIRGEAVKTSRIIEKIFGFEGMMASKNFKRNRKRYRSTVFSLFISIVLFISSSSFCSYLTGTVEGVTSSDTKMDISYSIFEEKGVKEDPEQVLKLLSGADGVTDALYYDYSPVSMITDYENLDESYIQRLYAETELEDREHGDVFGFLVFVNDEAFRALCQDNGMKPDPYFDEESPVGLFYNQGVVHYSDEEGGSIKWYNYKNLDESKFPCTVTHYAHKQYEGYYYYEEEIGADGKKDLVYYPLEYLQDYWNSTSENPVLDESYAMKVPAEDAELIHIFTVNAVVKETLFSLPSDTPAVIYPFSMEKIILDETYRKDFSYETHFGFLSNRHQKSYSEMEEILRGNSMQTYGLSDDASDRETGRMIVMIIEVLSYGFIILISLIAVANVFNTISTNIMLRRREFAMLRSIGLDQKGFRKMMNYECMIYGAKGVIYGLPVAVLFSYLIYRITGTAYQTSFYIPLYSVVIAVGSVFVVVFATMLYATGIMKKENMIDALKNENV